MSIEDLGKPTIREIDKEMAKLERERDAALLKLAEARKGTRCYCAACAPSNWPETNGWRCELSRKLAEAQAQCEKYREVINRSDAFNASRFEALGNWARLECVPEWVKKPIFDIMANGLTYEDTAKQVADALAQVRERAGRERAAQELDGLIEQTKRFGHTVKLSASSELWDFSTREELALLLSFLEQRMAGIAAEPWGGQ
jgi:hypothetical protein